MLRTCPSCKQDETKTTFYKKAEECRACIRTRVGAVDPAALATAVERHRQERIVVAELKKLAKQRFEKRRVARERRKKAALVEKVITKAPEGAVEVDPATKEMAQRELSRRRLIEFVQEFHPKYKAGWVHHDICRRLEKFSADVAAGKSPRLMILMPPRSGKSQLASKLFPAWHLGHHPDHEVIACSYNVSLALEFSREVRGVVRSERFSVLFPESKLDPEYAGAEAWKLLSPTGTGAGGYVAAGIGGPINGKGAHVLIVDDPIKNAEEAESIDHLRKIHTWFDAVAYLRLAPGGGVLLIQTWWSDNDLAGRIQEEMKENPEADQYEIALYPAIAVEDEEFRIKGDALHPERYDLKALERIKTKLGGDKGKYWNALYQQNPIPDEGAYFTKSMFVYRTERPDPKMCYLFQAWDFALGEKRVNDYTVGVTVAVDHMGFEHVLEVERFRTADQLKIADAILDMYERYPAARVSQIGMEDGQIWRGVKGHLARRMVERGLYPSIEELTPFTDKTIRARALQGRMQQRRVTFPRDAEWMGALTKEFLRFPAGMHDDIVDALAWCIILLLNHPGPRPPTPERSKAEKTVAEKLKLLGQTPGKGHMAA